ncbi:asparagine synthase-related protein [Sphingomonas sp. HF-S3]|uniref:asparagine synthase (glutamine-hydrolyzing) n=1 Tax=Sphingomonas rustica TaxID=3103142 RepID=A0ABV0B4M6_9SPHN
MRPRYLLLVGPEAVPAANCAAQATGLHLAWSAPSVAILVNDSCSCLEIDSQATVVGTLFHRHGPARPIEAFGEAEQVTLARDGTQALLRSYWGGYLALLMRGDAVEILRDPSASLPCYRARSGRTALFASDVDLLAQTKGEPLAIDWNALGRFLHSCGLPTTETALEGVSVLLPGDAILLDGASERTSPGWSPWDFVEPRAEEPNATVERLRRTIELCVAGLSARYKHPLVSLSGGLDSSIVAACLARAGRTASCLTMYTDDPAGDERGFAGTLCTELGLPLATCRYDLGNVDLGRALGAHLPFPVGRAEAQPYEAAHRAVAARVGADAFFSGNGGDNVFGFSQSAAALADRALYEGPGAGAFATLRDICRQTGAGPLRVTRAAARIAGQPAAYVWKPSLGFLHPDLIASLSDRVFTHRWLDAPPGALPGKAAHIAGLLRAHLTLESDRSRIAPLVNPLLAQPIVEACLSIPSWQWREGGRDRAAVRSAFAGRLPEGILARRVKGTPDPFCGEIVQRTREELRARLLDGQLVARRILDPNAIDEALRPDRSTSAEQNVRLLELVNAEAWCGGWS